MRKNKEVRRYKRYIVEDKNILSKALMNTSVELSDISKTGACVTAYERLQVEGRNFLELKSISGLFLECNIVWTNPNTAITNAHRMIAQSFTTGLQFKDLSPIKSIVLEGFLKSFQTPNIEKASSAFKSRAPRFKMQLSEKAKLYYLRFSMVKKISIGGMLIKTNSAFLSGKTMTLALVLAREDLLTELEGRVASIMPVASDGEHFFNIGIEFLNVNERNQVQLKRFIQLGALE